VCVCGVCLRVRACVPVLDQREHPFFVALCLRHTKKKSYLLISRQKMLWCWCEMKMCHLWDFEMGKKILNLFLFWLFFHCKISCENIASLNFTSNNTSHTQIHTHAYTPSFFFYFSLSQTHTHALPPSRTPIHTRMCVYIYTREHTQSHLHM